MPQVNLYVEKNMIFDPFKFLFLSSYKAIKKRKNSSFDSVVYALSLTSYCFTVLITIFVGTIAFKLNGEDSLDQIIDFMAEYGLIIYFMVVAFIYILYATKSRLHRNLEEFEKLKMSSISSIIVFCVIGITSLIAIFAMFMISII